MTTTAPSATAARPTGDPGVVALLADGSHVLIRALGEADVDAVTRLHSAQPPRDRYLRFFAATSPSMLQHEARRETRVDDARHVALGAFAGGELLGVADAEVLADPAEAEVAVTVAHEWQGRGVGALLIEHVASAARARGVRTLVADVLTENAAMLRVFHDFGARLTVLPDGPLRHVRLALDDDYPDAMRERERHADVASLRPLLRPRSIAVVGAGRSPSSVGHAVLRSVVDGGFRGRVWAVNPVAAAATGEIAGVPCVASVVALPDPVDLAVVCVPAAAVPAVAEECGVRGVRALVVLSAGLTGDTALSDALVDAVRRHGMRLVGPNCLGIVNTEPDVRLDATFARGAAPAGRVGVVSQSGGVGIALLAELGSAGLGVSTLVSTGDKYDVSGNDLLLWWLRDDATDVVAMYLESFGNPRKFARIATAVSRRVPIVTVRSGTSDAGVRAAASHTAAAATPVAVREALYAQTGVIAVDTMTELVAATCAFSWLPLPAGDRVAVIGNAGGVGVLAADACAAAGLTLPDLSPATTHALRTLLPEHASVADPVDTTAGVPDPVFAAALRAVLDDPGVDSVVVVTAPTAIADPARAVADVLGAARRRVKPVVVVQVGQTAAVEPLECHTPSAPSGDRPCVPSFGDPVLAVGAVAALTRRARWLARPGGVVPHLADIDADAARAVAARCPGGGWLGPDDVADLLRAVGLPVVPHAVVTGVDEAVAAAERLGLPVAVKAVTVGMLHKRREGGLELGLRDEAEVRQACTRISDRLGDRLTGYLVQPMIDSGRELLVGVHDDGAAGPVVVLGVGGTDAELVADRTCRVAPVTHVDAADMVRSLRASPLLFDDDLAEHRAADAAAVADVLIRVGRLAELVPQIAEADLNPVVVRGGRCLVPDARVRLQPRSHTDPYLRLLRIAAPGTTAKE